MERTIKRKEVPPKRRAQILAAAAELFSRHGYKGVTVDAIARGAGISKGNIYWYFRSKREIFQLLVDDFYQRLAMPLEQIADSDAPPRDKVRNLTHSLLDIAEANREAIILLLQVAAQTELRERVVVGASAWLKSYIDVLTDLFASLGEEKPRDVAMAYVAVIDSLLGQIAAVGSEIYDRKSLMAVLEERFISFRKDGDG